MVFLISYGTFMDVDWVSEVIGRKPDFWPVKIEGLRRSYSVIGGDWRRKYLILGIEKGNGNMNGILMELEDQDLERMSEYEKEYDLIEIDPKSVSFYKEKKKLDEPVRMFYPKKYFLYETAKRHFQKERVLTGEEYGDFVEKAAKKHGDIFHSDFMKTTRS